MIPAVFRGMIEGAVPHRPWGGRPLNHPMFHPGGANALFCDGSVKFLKDSVSQTIVWALGSRAQGEVVSADSY
jgi:prepilin-type processing-associated H-X9-DG protein